ncbi:Bardet-Biedl syndrome 10 protein isoform X2 [Rana temporaria]|uniref:Bardet-Biedl syndrome 10 protein isoform X2 n=1 Tax=Rana temporaria TaxID=8407 RepID=UPI001AAD3800|nr:Bardet-Biedl syndrome 10 protein isoform X2 [Rana temporaria]
MLQHTKRLDISKILQVAGSLEKTICRSFGPEGGQVLFIKSTGELNITRDGKKILECLLLDNPVARIIVSCASKHYSVTGDGVKSFVLLLCAFLREIQRTTDKNEDLTLSGNSAGKVRHKSKCHTLRRISDMLLILQTTVLEPIIREGLRPHFLSMYTNQKGNVTLCRASLQQTLDTYFCGRNTCTNQGFLSRLACDYLLKCLACADDIAEVVRFVDKFFSELHTQAPGFPVENCRILPGLVLHRDFSVYCPVEGDLRALIVTDSIQQSLSASGIGFVVSSQIQLQISQQYLEQRTENIMKQFQMNKIKLILSVVKQHEMVSFYARLYGISIVECIPSEEIDLLCTAAGVTPVSTVLSDHLQNNYFLVKTCQPILIGDKKYVHLVFSGSLAFKLHSIVLYGPVRGLSEQIASSFHGAFKMLKQLFQPVDASWELPLNNPDFCLPNRRVSAEEQRVTFSNCQNDSDCSDCHLQRMDQYTPMQGTSNVPGDISDCSDCHMQRMDQYTPMQGTSNVPGDISDCSDCHMQRMDQYTPMQGTSNVPGDISDCSDCHLQRMDQYTPMQGTSNVPGDISEPALPEATYSLRTCSHLCIGNHMCLHQLEQSIQQVVEGEPAQRLRCSVNLKSKLPADVISHKQTLSTNIGLVLPSGGVFEMLLHHHLHNFAKTCQEAELAMVCTVFGEALLCIPKHIYKARKERFPLVYKQCIDALKSKEPIDITQTGLESVSCKYQLMASVLQCISKLVTVDLIIGINKGSRSVSCEEIN